MHPDYQQITQHKNSLKNAKRNTKSELMRDVNTGVLRKKIPALKPGRVEYLSLTVCCYASIVTGFSMYCLSVWRNCAPVAPSTVLWSQVRVTVMVLPTTI